MFNSNQPIYIPVLSDIHDADQMKGILSLTNNDFNFEVKKDEEIVTRSAFSDPTVLVALIGAGATTLAALIGLIGVIWSSRKKDKKASDDTGIVITISSNSLNTIIQKNPDKKSQLQALFDNSLSTNTLELTPESAASIHEEDNPYHLLFNELLPEEVEHVVILEDD